jgi:hypothetical protein
MFSTETDRNPKTVVRQVQRQQLDAGAVAGAGAEARGSDWRCSADAGVRYEGSRL